MKEDIYEFVSSTEKNQSSVIFFSGHGINVNGELALVPSMQQLPETKEAISSSLVSISEIKSWFSSTASPSALFLFCDCCRSVLDISFATPFSSPLAPPSSSNYTPYLAPLLVPLPNFNADSFSLRRGPGPSPSSTPAPAPVPPPSPILPLSAASQASLSSNTNIFIGYSTDNLQAAFDGKEGENSLFSRSLSDAIEQKNGMEIHGMFSHVSIEVKEKSRERQMPWIETGLNGAIFSLGPYKGTLSCRIIPPVELDVIDDDINSNQVLGRGATAKVVAATWTVPHSGHEEQVAKKVINHLNHKEKLETEISLLWNLRHKNIVELKGAYFSESECYVVMERMTISLEEFLELNYRKYGSTPSDDEVFQIVEGVARALSYLQALKPPHGPIVHGDIKAGNILLNIIPAEDGSVLLCPKITDFGISRLRSSITATFDAMSAPTSSSLQPQQGTLAYLSPELHHGAPSSQASDVFAFGCLLFETLTAIPPFFQPIYQNPVTLFEAVSKGQRPYVLGKDGDLDPSLPFGAPIDSDEFSPLRRSLMHLCTQCWSQSPKQRPTFEYIVNFLKSIKPASLIASNASPLAPPVPSPTAPQQQPELSIVRVEGLYASKIFQVSQVKSFWSKNFGTDARDVPLQIFDEAVQKEGHHALNISALFATLNPLNEGLVRVIDLARIEAEHPALLEPMIMRGFVTRSPPTPHEVSTTSYPSIELALSAMKKFPYHIPILTNGLKYLAQQMSSSSSASQTEISSKGGIEIVLDCMRLCPDSESLLESGCCVLEGLCMEKGYHRSRAVTLGCVEVLMMVLRGKGSHSVRERALSVLCCLSDDKDAKRKLVSLSGVELILSITQQHKEDDFDSDIPVISTNCLLKLMKKASEEEEEEELEAHEEADDELKSLIFAAGGLSVLLSNIAKAKSLKTAIIPKETELSIHAVNALCVSFPFHAKSFVSMNGLKIVVDVLKKLSSPSSSGASSASLLVSILKLLVTLIQSNHDLKTRIASFGGVSSVLDTLLAEESVVEIQEIGCRLICFLSSNDACKSKLLEYQHSGRRNHAIPLLLECMRRHACNHSIQSDLLSCFFNMTSNSSSPSSAMAKDLLLGSINLITTCMKNFESDASIHEKAINLLHIILVSPSSSSFSPAAVDSEVLQAVTSSIIRHQRSFHPSFQKTTILPLLSHLLNNSTCGASGSMTPTLEALLIFTISLMERNKADASIQCEGMSVLGGIVKCDGSHSTVSQKIPVDLILDSMKLYRLHTKIQEAGCSALHALAATNPIIRNRIVNTTDALEVLFGIINEFLNPNERAVPERAIVVVSQLMQGMGDEPVLLDLMGELADFLSIHSGSAIVCMHVIQIFLGIAKHTTRYLKHIRYAGLIVLCCQTMKDHPPSSASSDSSSVEQLYEAALHLISILFRTTNDLEDREENEEDFIDLFGVEQILAAMDCYPQNGKIQEHACKSFVEFKSEASMRKFASMEAESLKMVVLQAMGRHSIDAALQDSVSNFMLRLLNYDSVKFCSPSSQCLSFLQSLAQDESSSMELRNSAQTILKALH